ncbi:MAG: cyclic pyranopterin monophosphate synthase MoaC, partial [Cyanobium sp.]
MPSSLTHLNGRGEAHMVDVAAKPATAREALAEGFLQLAPEALALVREGGVAKGDVLAVARVAAIQAAKRTAELIPLCHPLPLAAVEVTIDENDGALRVSARVRTSAPTGVE